MLIVVGIYLVVIPYILRLNEISYSLISAFSQTFIIVGIISYALQFITRRLTRIEEQLEISKENKVASVSLIPSENHIAFVEQLKRNRFAYKASIYLPNSNIENLFFLKSFLNTIKLDSKARIIINTNNIDQISKKNIEEITSRFHNQIELKNISSKNNQNFSIVILDTTVWVLADFGMEIRNSLVFNVSSYGEQGKSFIEFYNKIWNESEIIKSTQDEI
ncbi:hypothetical protein DD829_06260 [Chryseobacterium sp. HMWF035]|nr:hypothetical protein DD829_06260 [Chryseobacterium sp. HMWF035]